MPVRLLHALTVQYTIQNVLFLDSEIPHRPDVVQRIRTEHLSEAGADILALHRLNLYPFIIVLYKYIGLYYVLH